MSMDLEQIINEVLYRLGKLDPICLVLGLPYEEDQIHAYHEGGYVKWFDLKDLIQHSGDVVLPELTLRQMMSAYSGQPCDAVSEALMYLTLYGCTVRIDAHRIEWKAEDYKPSPYMRRFQEAYDCFIESGLKPVDEKPVCEKHVGAYQGKLINEAYARQFVLEGNKDLYVSPDTIVTPLATDYLKQHQVHVRRT